MSKIGLIDENDIPVVGLASFCANEVKETREVVEKALDAGIRHFEIAELFGNGHIIVEAIIAREIKRADVFLTLKVWPKDRGAKETVQACLDSLESFGLQFADAILLHAPIDTVNDQDQWRAFEYLQKEGLTKTVGVANLTEQKLTEVLKNSTTSGGPALVEMECTPYRQSEDLVSFCADGGIVVLNNNPTGKRLKSELGALLDIAGQAECSQDMLLTRWAVQKGHAVLISPELLDIPDFSVANASLPLGTAVVKQLDELEQGLVTSFVTRDIAPDE
jgi:diketogulonate reductase-like aldo/keto reductase